MAANPAAVTRPAAPEREDPLSDGEKDIIIAIAFVITIAAITAVCFIATIAIVAVICIVIPNIIVIAMTIRYAS